MFPRQILPAVCVLAIWACAAEAGQRPEAPPLPEARSTAKNLPSLHPRIDELLAAAQSPTNERDSICSDAEFLRRIFLDLVGSVPSADTTREFLADDSPVDEKRRSLVDRLLKSPRHARRMQYVFDEMIMERRKGANVPDAEWRNWLRTAFQENRPWDALVEEILAADGAKAEKRPASKFYLDRNFDVDLVTRDVGRVFLGVDLECAQCHDHPTIDGYLQRHYWGISAFLKRSYLHTDSKSKKKILGEKAEGDVKFTSVFTSVEGMTNPRLMDLPEIPDPKGVEKAYLVKPASKVAGVPKYSRRLQLPRAMTSEENVDFRRNIANRIWAMMMGRGLVEPLDVRHSDNPPTNPKLLDLLADELMHSGYDLRWLIREVALTQAYQRSQIISGGEDSLVSSQLKPLSPEQLAWAVMDVTGVSKKALDTKQAEQLKKKEAEEKKRADDPVWKEEALHNALKANVDQFVAQFAGQGGQKTGFESTAVQALFLLNGSLIQGWLAPANGNLTDRLCNLDENSAFAEELYVSILSRKPSAEEAADVAAYLDAVEDRNAAAQELAWALLTSAEFRFNH